MPATKTQTKPTLARTAILAAMMFGSLMAPVPAQADDGCIPGDAPGRVPRNARPGDMVCVPKQIASQVQQENATAEERRDPSGAYGPMSCKSGFVWREAFDGDTVCVTPNRREVTWQQNANAGVGATGGLAPQPGANGCKWEYSGPAVLDLADGSRVEMQFYGLTATGPYHMIFKTPINTEAVLDGEIISAYGDEPGKSTFTILWTLGGKPVNTYDFSGEIDPRSGTMSGTAKDNSGTPIGWNARQTWTCGR